MNCGPVHFKDILDSRTTVLLKNKDMPAAGVYRTI